jgi:alpha-galactosidase
MDRIVRNLICGVKIPTLSLAIGLLAVGLASERNAGAEDKKPLKVFILAGQSNMQGHAHVRTIKAMRLNPQAKPILDDILNADGSFRQCKQVWITSIGSAADEQVGKVEVGFGAKERGPKIGPEYTFGIYLEKALEEPVLIIKTAWGGKSLNTDFRPPGAGPFEFSESQLETWEKQNKDIAQIKAEKEKATGVYYRMMIDHIRNVLGELPRIYPDADPDQDFELAGFVWFQGWNDMVDRGVYPNRDQPGGYDQYTTLLAQFIRDVRSDLDAPELPFVIGVMGVGGPTDAYGPEEQRYQAIHQNFRDAMAAVALSPEFEKTVSNVLTEIYWDAEVVALRKREKELKAEIDQIRQRVKEGQRTRAQGDEEIERLYANAFDDRELEILRSSTSNFEFHYLGSAGIMTQIGKGFADAMLGFVD